MMGIAILVGAVVAVIFATGQAKKGWGTGPAVAVAVVGTLVTLIVPLVALILCAVIFGAARNAHLAKVAAGDDPVIVDPGTFAHADRNNPFSPPGFGSQSHSPDQTEGPQ